MNLLFQVPLLNCQKMSNLLLLHLESLTELVQSFLKKMSLKL